MPQGAVGANTAKTSSGAYGALSVDAQNANVVGQAHGKYYESAYAGRTFVGANATGATLSAALATTYVGLCLSNPAGSGKNLAVQRIMGQIIVAPAAVLALGLIGGYAAAGVATHTTPLTPLVQKIGLTATPVGLVDAACTIVGTPAWLKWLATTAVADQLPSFIYDSEGAIVLMPGAYLAVGANVAGPAAGFVGSIEWEELPQ